MPGNCSTDSEPGFRGTFGLYQSSLGAPLEVTQMLRLLLLLLLLIFETNINNNAERKHLKYSRLVSDLRSQYTSVTFVNLSMSALGIYANSCLSFSKMYDSLSIDNQQKRFLISKLSKISIRTTYYIFCCRDKPRSNPDLLCF